MEKNKIRALKSNMKQESGKATHWFIADLSLIIFAGCFAIINPIGKKANQHTDNPYKKIPRITTPIVKSPPLLPKALKIKRGVRVRGLKEPTIRAISAIVKDCGKKCNVVLTSATEGSHKEGGHDEGRKFDLRTAENTNWSGAGLVALDKFIMTGSFSYSGERGDGPTYHSDKYNTSCTLERKATKNAHWDCSVKQ